MRKMLLVSAVVLVAVVLATFASEKKTRSASTKPLTPAEAAAKTAADKATALRTREILERWSPAEPVRADAKLESLNPLALRMGVDPTTSGFRINFVGLICHAKVDKAGGASSARRALLVAGKSGMEHEARIIFDEPTDSGDAQKLKDDLYAATGNHAVCAKHLCGVAVGAAEMRIRGDGGVSTSTALNTLSPDHSFDCLVPNIKTLAMNQGGSDAATDIPSAYRTNPPSGKLAALFEIDGGGTLSACPFGDGGLVRDPKTGQDSCLQFAKTVSWTGSTSGVAVVQIRTPYSIAQGSDFVTIRAGNGGTLRVGVSNEPPTQIAMTSAHFVLFNDLLSGGKVPSITACTVPTFCSNCGVSGSVVIPGCSDTQWP